MKKITTLSALVLIAFAVITSACSTSSDSDPAAQIPVITALSNDVLTVRNVPEEIFVTVEIGDKGTLSYQWYVAESKIANGEAMPDATESRFSPATDETGTYYYYCVITNRLGSSTRSVTSPRITYAVSDSVNALTPTIAAQPANVTADFGEDFLLSVIAYAADGGTLSYQWYFSVETAAEATAIDGATEASYKGVVSAETSGLYYCLVTNTISDNGDGGEKSASVQTNTAIVSNSVVHANTPAITAQPESLSAIIPVICVFSVAAYTADDGALSYQWYKVLDGESDGTEIAEETNARLKITTNELGRSGYYCVVTNTISDNGDGGTKSVSVQSETAWLDAVFLKDVISAPAFTEQPSALNIAPYNQSVELACTAESVDGTVSYRWYKSADGTAETGTAVTGATASTLTIDPITEKGMYYYYCVATTVLSENDDLNIKSAAAISNVVRVAYTGLPTLYFDADTPIAAITKTEYTHGTIKVISEEYGNFSYTFSQTKEGIKGRGNSSWGMPKKGYNIKFDKKQSLFGLPKAKKWCIIANYPDKSLLRNKFASVLGNEILNSVWNPSFVSVDVVLNGEYLGNYIFCEKITLSDGRIEVQDIADVDENLATGKESKVTDANGDGAKDLVDGGFILEVDSRLDADFYFKTTKGVSVTLKDPDDVSEAVFERIKIVVQTAENALYGADFTDTEKGWQRYLDATSFADWFIANELTKNNDAIFFSSVYMYYNPADGKLYMGPNWDFDISCGNVNYNGCDNPEGWWIKNAAWISRLFQDPVFVSAVQSRWNEKKSELYNAISGTSGGIQSLADNIAVSAELNFLKWNILGAYVWPNAAGYADRTTYQSEVDYMIDWLNRRYTWLDNAIGGL